MEEITLSEIERLKWRMAASITAGLLTEETREKRGPDSQRHIQDMLELAFGAVTETLRKWENLKHHP